jgi:hypothetical protein
MGMHLRPMLAVDALGQTKQYCYAIDNNLIGLTYLNAVNPAPNVSFTYDPYFVRGASMMDGAGTTTYTHNPSYANGAQQLAQECFTATGASDCSHAIAYGYDALGRSVSRQISSSGVETSQYDAIGRMASSASSSPARRNASGGTSGGDVVAAAIYLMVLPRIDDQ